MSKKILSLELEAQQRWTELCQARQLTADHPARFPHGSWSFAYLLSSKKLPLRSVRDVLHLARRIQGHETGWPAWLILDRQEMEPYPIGEYVESWLAETRFADAAHSDFWRIGRQGFAFLLRGYQEDSLDSRTLPGKKFDLGLPIWRIGECLLHAIRFAISIDDPEATLDVNIRWTGLKNRELSAWASRRHVRPGRVCRVDSVPSAGTFEIEYINKTLPSVIRELTLPLFHQFDFFEPSIELVTEEVARLRSSQA